MLTPLASWPPHTGESTEATEEEKGMQIVHIDRSEAKAPDHPEWFPGVVHQQRMNDPPDERGIELIAVWFDPGSRTKPHVHAVDQVLQVVEGEGVVATEDWKRIIRPGDWVVVPAGVWHWHGATPDSAMCHISIKQPAETDWSSPWKNFDTYMDGATDA
jgi:quercetin dioxygenase-like cupin family protein